jgi:transcriptional regulator with XRE-family HTH domain
MANRLGAKLAAARKKRGLSLRQVEKRTQIHNAHLSQIEQGTIERPDPNILWTLATIYELDYADLMRLAGHIRRERGGSGRRSLAGAALYALEDLTPEEQQEVIDFMGKVRRSRTGEGH